MLRNADWGGGVRFYGKKRYKGVRLTIICVMRGWVVVQFPQKKRYVTLEWLLSGGNANSVLDAIVTTNG